MVREKAKKPSKKIAALNVKRMKLEDLVPAGYNPRTITDDALAGLGKSVEEFGLVEPLVWNKRTGRLVSGHQRLKVLVRQGVDEADVSVVDLDEAREKVLNVTLNNQVIQGEWATTELDGLLKELQAGEEASGLFQGMKLGELLEGLILPKDPEAPDQFPQIGEDIDTEHECPKCGYQWSGKKK